MIFAWRLLVFVEWTLITLLAIGLLILTFDLFQAWNASACSAGASTDCYPWGAEGPVSELWNYASKRNYLVASAVSVLTISFTLLGALVVSQGRRILVLLAGVAVGHLGYYVVPRLFS